MPIPFFGRVFVRASLVRLTRMLELARRGMIKIIRRKILDVSACAAALIGLCAFAQIAVANSSTVTETQKITASDAAADDHFGVSVAISGDTAVVGANFDDDGFDNSGSAYVFVQDGNGNWTQESKLTAMDAAMDDNFGISVAISGDTAVVGANFDDGGGIDSGAAYVFERDGMGVWAEMAKLTASDAAADDDFASSVAISGDTIVVGASFHDGDGGGIV